MREKGRWLESEGERVRAGRERGRMWEAERGDGEGGSEGEKE